jgi:hypothetical protein
LQQTHLSQHGVSQQVAQSQFSQPQLQSPQQFLEHLFEQQQPTMKTVAANKSNNFIINPFG